MPQENYPKLQQNIQKDEYYKLELSQVVERIDSLGNLRVQLGTFFGTANVTALGVALSVQKAGILFIAASMLVIYLLLDARIRGLSVAYFWRGICLQRKFVPNDDETFLQILPGGIASEARKLSDKTGSQRLRGKQQKGKVAFSGLLFRGFYYLMIAIVMFGEMATGLLLWIRFNWLLF